jgi:hypothetical protein
VRKIAQRYPTGSIATAVVHVVFTCHAPVDYAVEISISVKQDETITHHR